MTKIEKLADDVGQITFRLECNMSSIGRYRSEGTPIHPDVLKSINSDIEKLKQIKTRIQDLENENHNSQGWGYLAAANE